MNVHFIAIGGSVMHNLALALRKKGHQVSGSDDEIFDPARGRLQAAGLLPLQDGWFPEKVHPGLDAIILGMHAKAGNPELERAQALGLPIYSFPEFVFQQAKDKKRVVVAGSHGKTTITAMVMHALRHHQMDFDYLVGAQLDGFDLTVGLTQAAPVIILEGDEYLTSALHPVPKFLCYQPHIALISGIAWDHINVFPTFENYREQFERFVRSIEARGTLIYNEEEEAVREVAAHGRQLAQRMPYRTPAFEVEGHETVLTYDDHRFRLKIFGAHNLQNLAGAQAICAELGIEALAFLQAMRTFEGAAKRLETIAVGANATIFRDFAHAPSKVAATVRATKAQYPQRQLVACLELHTYSSLNKKFLPHYAGTMQAADVAVIFIDRHALELKQMEPVSAAEVKAAFGQPGMQVFFQKAALLAFFHRQDWTAANLLLMSSGNFGGLKTADLSNFVRC